MTGVVHMIRNISTHISDRSHYNLTMNIYNCGNQDISIERREKPDHYILYFVNEGRGSVTVRKAAYKVKAGQGFVVFPGVETMITPHYKETMNASWIAFSGYLVDRYLSRANLSVYEPIFSDNADGEEAQCFDSLIRTSTRFPNRYCKMMSYLYLLFSMLLDNTNVEAQPNAATPEYYLVRALDFIDTNYYENILVEDIASAVGITKKAITSVFTSLTGYTPKAYLIYYRLCKSVDLLKDPNLSMDAIASSVGYSDQFYFSKQFKKNVGMTPSQCRKILISDPSWTYRSPIDAVREQFRSHASDESLPKF